MQPARGGVGWDGGVEGVGWGWTYATDWQCGASPRSYFESLSTSGPPEGMDSGSGGGMTDRERG